MSYTIVLTEERRAMEFENSVNRAARRCRIVNVKLKNSPVGPFGLPVFPPMVMPWQATPNICQSCDGKACGNAGCPLKFVATCERVEAFESSHRLTPLYQS